MLFNSIEFLFFFPIVTILFFVIPKKLKSFWLLLASYYFYMSWNPNYALLIAASTLATYASGIALDKINKNDTFDDNKKTSYKKGVVAASLIFNLGILVIFKYANFILANFHALMNAAGFEIAERSLDLLLPVGISFYTFQALSYTLDVYRGTIKAEQNIIKYALFVSFFPQLVAGPIERSTNLLEQIRKIQTDTRFDFENLRSGLLLMFWGLFQKLVIADRAAILVDTVYNNYTSYGLVSIAIATIVFAFQIYCDFDGYTNVARGAAKVIGIDLMKNFHQPYLAENIRDFWKRWHISLTTWFTDYLYIPLGGNRKGLSRQLINVCIIFTVSGLWHGASWNYVVWGVLHAVYQCIGILKRKLIKPSNEPLSFSRRLEKKFVTFALTSFAWIFFRAESLSHGFAVIRQMLSQTGFGSLMFLGLDSANIILLITGLIILLIVDLVHEYNISIREFVYKQRLWFRWTLYLVLIWSIIMFGIYGIDYTSSQFIYFQF